MEKKDFITDTAPETTEIAVDAAVNKMENADFLKREVPPEEKIPTKEKIFYGLGAMMDGGGVALMSCVMMNYMTDSIGIAAASASTIMMASKIWDAVTDPVMGHISDNTHSKYGRRKPFMIIGGILLVFALALLFAPIKEWGLTNQSGLVAYILIFYIIWNTCSTITQVPYTSMSSDISPSFKERNNANTVKLVFSSAAAGLAYVVPLLLLGAYQSGSINAYAFWIIMVVVFGTLFGGGLVLAGIFTKERIKLPKDAVKKKFDIKEFLKGYVKPYKNKSYRWHIIMYVSAFTCMDMLSALAAYYASHVWRGQSLFGMNFGSMFIVAPLMVAAVIAFPLIRVVMDKKGKAFAFRMGLPLYIVGGILLAVCDPAWCPPIVIPLAAFVMGFGFGGAQMVPWMIFPDTLDVAEMRTGERPTGNYSGMMTLVRKVSGALGVGIVGWVLSGIGYDNYLTAVNGMKSYLSADAFGSLNASAIKDVFTANASEISAALAEMQLSDPGINVLTAAEISDINVSAVLLTIRLLMGISVCVLISIALIASLKYKITNKKLVRVKYFLDHMHNGTLDQLTDEERKEMEKMGKDLVF